MTLIAASPVPADPAIQPGTRTVMWDVQVTERGPAMVRTVRAGGRVRLVVVEGANQSWTKGFLAELHRCAACPPGETADALLGQAGLGMHCSSLTILDAGADGRVQIAVRQAPPAILLRARRRGVVVLDGTDAAQDNLHAVAGDLLILFSASFLEEPPEVLGRVRSASDPPAVPQLRQALAQATTAGASVTLMAHPLPVVSVA